MLDKNQKSRIKIAAIKSHPFFKNFNFTDVYSMKMTPPINVDQVKILIKFQEKLRRI